jgi:prophage regulatory protein
MDIQHLQESPADRLLPVSETAATAGVGRSKIYRLLAEGAFPAPVKIGRKTLFSEREVQAWIEEQLSRRQEQDHGRR